MKKKLILSFCFMMLFIFIPNVYAEDLVGRNVIADDVFLRVGPSALTDKVFTATIPTGTVLTIKEVATESPVDSTKCDSDTWYKVNYNNQDGYVCSNNANLVAIASDYNVTGYGIYNGERVPIIQKKSGTDSTGCTEYKVLIDNNKIKCASYTSLTDIKTATVLDTNNISYDYNTELSKFPSDYQSLIAQIHSKHSNWRFYAVNTGLDFNEAVVAEQNNSLIQYRSKQKDGSYIIVNNVTYLDVTQPANYNWKTNTWVLKESNEWASVSKTATAFYLDPRNYLTINNLGSDGYDYKKIFAFEDGRAYTYQENGNLDKMLEYAGISSSSITDADGNSVTYRQAFTDGATFSKANAAMLIARSRNETDKFGSYSVTGTYTTKYGKYNNIDLNGYYNYFNVGATGASPVANGLIYARNAGWNNRYSSIVEGSTFVANKYIYNNQETQYFQKFNVNPASTYGAYTHEYQTNIQVLLTEGGFDFWGYKDSGNIDLPIVFYIPVYNNMPSTISVEPKNGNPNNWLTNLTIDGTTVSGFDGDKYYSYDDNFDGVVDETLPDNVYKYTLAWNKSSINIGTSTAVSTSSVSGNGDISITNKTTDINVVVTAQNGTTKTYKIIVTKEDTPELDENGNPIYPAISDVLNATGIKYNDSSNYVMGLSYGTTRDTLVNKLSSVSSLVKVTIDKNRNNGTANLATGDTIKIVSGTNTKSYSYVLYGDSDGDGYIGLTDLVDCRNIILKTSNLSSLGRTALDTDKSGVIDVTDLVNIRNTILNTGTIQQ